MTATSDSESDLDFYLKDDPQLHTIDEIKQACFENGVQIEGSFEWVKPGESGKKCQVDLSTNDLSTSRKSPLKLDSVPTNNDKNRSHKPDDQNQLIEEIIVQNGTPDRTITEHEDDNFHGESRIKRPMSFRERNKIKRMRVEDYIGFSVIRAASTSTRRTPQDQSRNARKMGLPCRSILCKKRNNRFCHDFSDDVRANIFHNFWSWFNWGEKQAFVHSLVDKILPRRCTVKSKTSRKNETFMYHLKLHGVRKQVCKNMFMSTLGIGKKQLRNWVVNKSCEQKHPVQSIKERKGGDGAFAGDFLQQLPKLPSHYCRKDTKKMYLEPVFRSRAHLYAVYVQKCKEKNTKEVAYSTFFTLVDKKNIALHRPKKDQCDTCCSFFTGNLSANEYNIHIGNKEAAREEKCNDKENALDNTAHVITVDVQKVLLSPVLNASALYYKTKLIVHNFTVFDLATRNVKCYLWDESNADLVASVFASCLISYLDENYKDNLPVVIFSDGCTSQNRNAILSNALLHYAVKTNKTIVQKYLEKGHTQMEVDTVHSKIETRMRRVSIYQPSDYIDICKNARKAHGGYDVRMMTFSEFKDYSVNRAYKSIRPGNRKTDPHVTDIRQIKYNPDGTLEYKLDHKKDWIPFPRLARVDSKEVFPPLYKARIPISKRKYEDLQDLLRVLPSHCHNFYKSLPFK